METPINKKEELKPCPFCADKFELYDEDGYYLCPRCGFTFDISGFRTLEEAIVVLNRRPQPNDKSPIQGSSLNTQKSLGVSEPSLVQENVDSQCDDPIHQWFSLSYASWLTLPRVLMQEMPLEWQEKMKDLLDEIDEAFPNAPCPRTRVVVVKNGKLTKTPDWIKDYRHPDLVEVNKCRPNRGET